MPALGDALRVSPNEITLERPYLANNIQLTRQGYGITHREIGRRVIRNSVKAVVDAYDGTVSFYLVGGMIRADEQIKKDAVDPAWRTVRSPSPGCSPTR